MKPLFFILTIYIVYPVLSIAQCDEIPESNVLNGNWVEEQVPLKKVVLYPYLRESDILWSKRIWRTIDLRERLNLSLYYPEFPLSDRLALWHIIKYAALCEGMTLYNVFLDGDNFQYPVNTYNEKYGLIYKTDSILEITPTGVPVFDENGDYQYNVYSYSIEAYEIIEYHIKEDIFYDKERSVMETRIIGIAPVVYDIDPTTLEIRGKKELFWVYFPELRYYMQNEAAYNPMNDAMDISFDDLFQKRMFSSYIYKESNVYDRKIMQYQTGVNALLEAENIKAAMFSIEHDMWNF